MSRIPKDYIDLTPADYIERIEPGVLATLGPQQLDEFSRILATAIPKPAPKIVDLRFTIDLLVQRFYIVLWVGKDRRKSVRRYPQTPVTRVANLITACILLLALNLMVTTSLLMGAYLVKSASGINLLSGHLSDYLPDFL